MVPSTGKVVTAKAGVPRGSGLRPGLPGGVCLRRHRSARTRRVVPLQYSIKAGQKYVLADDSIDTDYYYATIFDASDPTDHIVVNGQDKYDEIWFGHRMFYVRKADISVG